MIQSYKSTYHPRGRPAVVVRSQAMRMPLTITSLVLMIFVCVDVLVGSFMLSELFWGVVLALAAAAIISFFRLRRQISEVLIQPHYAAVRTTHDVLIDAPADWGPIYDVRKSGDTLTLTVEWSNYELPQTAWPEYDALITTLQRHRHRPPES